MQKTAPFQYSLNPYSQSITATYCKHPYGMLMDGRSYSSSDYRWGFNGMEKNTEINSNGSNLDFGARIYDGRIGRWMSVDPESFKGPFFSPYISMNNNPLFNMDPDGNWVIVSTTKFYKSGENLKVKHWYHIFKKTASIRKEITVGDVRFFDSNSVPLNDDQKKLLIENYQAQLISTFNNKTLNEKDKPPITLIFCMHDEPIFVPNLKNLRGNEEVVIFGPLLTKQKEEIFNGISYYSNRSLMGIYNQTARVGKESGVFAHEFSHQRSKNALKEILFQVVMAIIGNNQEAGYFDHGEVGVYSRADKSDRQVNYENANSIKKGSKGINKRKLNREIKRK